MKILLSILGAVGLGVAPAAVSTNLLSQQENVQNNNLNFAVGNELDSYTGVAAFGGEQYVTNQSKYEVVITWEKLGMSYNDLVKNHSTLKLDYDHCYVSLKSGSETTHTYKISTSELSLTSAFKFTSEWTKSYLLSNNYGSTSLGHVVCEVILYTQAGLDGIHFKTETYVEAGGMSYWGAYAEAGIYVDTISII